MSGEYYHRDILHKFWFNDFHTYLILLMIKISTLKIVQPLKYSQGNTQSIFYFLNKNTFSKIVERYCSEQIA